jgi:Sugar phosphate permease
MAQNDIKIYGYRWVVLGVFALINAIVQLQWIIFAPITNEAAKFYGVTPIQIGFLSMIFMIVYIFISFPASLIINTFGIRIGVGIGAVLTGIFGLLKGIYAANYNIILISQIGLAVAQPFILNSITAVSARWFPIRERATAAGIASLAQFMGIIVGMAATPYLTAAYEMRGMLISYGVISFVSMLVFLAFMREKPPTPPCPPEQESRILIWEGFKHIFKQKDLLILLFTFFICLGIFNAISTWIEQIIDPRGFTSAQAGIVGAMIMIGGIMGASILPLLSDKYQKRKLFLLLAITGTLPGLVGITFAMVYWQLLLWGFVFGFFIMGAYPLGFQYTAEISYPAPETASQGLVVLAGQISGIVFIYGMDKFKIGNSMTPFMMIFIGLLIINILICFILKESRMIKSESSHSNVM